jgi:hypothetical protein
LVEQERGREDDSGWKVVEMRTGVGERGEVERREGKSSREVEERLDATQEPRRGWEEWEPERLLLREFGREREWMR